MPFYVDQPPEQSNWNETDTTSLAFILNKPALLKGDQGIGIKGSQGSVGEKGSDGSKGSVGDKGSDGSKGNESQVAGPKGSAGIKGIQGDSIQGEKGVAGESITGSKGEPSTVAGPKGNDGSKGSDGDSIKGEKGGVGERGQKGSKGEIGIIGITGSKGSKGELGLPGEKGIDGSKGPIGLTGDKGEKAENSKFINNGSLNSSDEIEVVYDDGTNMTNKIDLSALRELPTMLNTYYGKRLTVVQPSGGSGVEAQWHNRDTYSFTTSRTTAQLEVTKVEQNTTSPYGNTTTTTPYNFLPVLVNDKVLSVTSGALNWVDFPADDNTRVTGFSIDASHNLSLSQNDATAPYSVNLAPYLDNQMVTSGALNNTKTAIDLVRTSPLANVSINIRPILVSSGILSGSDITFKYDDYDATNNPTAKFDVDISTLQNQNKLPSTTDADKFAVSTTTANNWVISDKLSLNPARFGENTPTSLHNESTFFGVYSGYGSNSSHKLTCFGYRAGESSNIGNATTCLGYRAGDNSNGNTNTFVGFLAGNNVVGSQNFALGEGSMDGGTMTSCIGIGRYAFRGATAQRSIGFGVNIMGSGFNFHTYATNSEQRSGNDKFLVGHNTSTAAWTTTSPNTGNPYLLDGTMGSNDSVRSLKINANEFHLPTTLPFLQPTADTQIWKYFGFLVQGAIPANANFVPAVLGAHKFLLTNSLNAKTWSDTIGEGTAKKIQIDQAFPKIKLTNTGASSLNDPIGKLEFEGNSIIYNEIRNNVISSTTNALRSYTSFRTCLGGSSNVEVMRIGSEINGTTTNNIVVEIDGKLKATSLTLSDSSILTTANTSHSNGLLTLNSNQTHQIIPDYSSQSDKFLKVNTSNNLEWGNVLPNYSGTSNQFLNADSGTLTWQQLNKIDSGQVVVNGATTTIELYNKNHTTASPDKVNINVSSLAMPDYSGTNNQFLNANSGTLTWQQINKISSGQLVETAGVTNIVLYNNNHTTAVPDLVNINVSALTLPNALPSYNTTVNQFLKANNGVLSWEFPNTITSGDIVGSNLVLYLDDYDATTNPNDKISIDISDLQTGVSSFQSSPTTSATYLCSYINSRLPDTSSALGFLFLNTNGTSEYKMPSSVETQTTLNTYSTFYINEFLSTASVGYKNLKFKSNNTTTGQTLGVTDSWMSDGSNGYDRLTAITHNIANSSTKSGKIEFYTYNNLQTHGMAHLAMYLQDAKAYFQEITVANAITLMSGSITSNIINKCPANPQVHLESTNTSSGTIVIGNYKVKAPITSTASVAYPPQLSSASQTVSGITYTITSSSNLLVGSIYDRFRAFDKNTLNTGWHTTAVFASSGGAYTGSQSLNSTSGEWLKVHMTTAQPFGSVKIVGRNGYASQDIKTWEILASNNDVNWTVLHQANAQQSYNGGNGTTTTFSNTNAYNYYALLVKSIQGPNGQTYGVVHELEFLTVATQVSTDVVDLKATKYSDDYTILDLQTRQAGLMTNAIRVGKTTANDINRITLTGNTTVIGQFTNNNLKISGTGSSITFNSGLQQTEAVVAPTTAQEGYRLTANGSSGWAWSSPDVFYDGTDRNINIGPENPSLGVDSISIGYYAGQISTTRSREQSVFIGTRAGQNTISTSTDTGKQFDNVVMIGHQAGQNSQYMENCCAIGSNAGASVDANPHSNSNFIGYYAGHDSGNANTGGSAYSNGFFGTFAGRNYVGIESQGFGRDALYTYQKSTTMRYRNNAIGSTSMRNCIGDDNCAQGSATLRWDGSGTLAAHRNIAIGSDAMGLLTNSGCQNSNDNVFIGRQSGRNLSGNATGNVSVGKNSGYEMVGSKNVMLGTQAGYQHNGSNCIYIGENQGYQQTESNKLKIGTFQNQQIISGTMNSTSATSELALNAKRIDLPTSDLPTAYDSTKPNQLYVKNGQLRIGVDKDYYLKVSGQSTQTFGRSWTTYLFPTVDTDHLDVDGGSVWDSSVGHAVIQHDGLYFVSGTMRVKDSTTPENTNFAVAIHTSNNDGSHTIWDAVLDTTNNYDRTTVSYSKIVRFTQDQGVRTIIYFDHATAQQMQMAEMVIYRLGD